MANEQFRLPNGKWHDNVRTNYVPWVVGACNVSLKKELVEIQHSDKPPECPGCFAAWLNANASHTSVKGPDADPRGEANTRTSGETERKSRAPAERPARKTARKPGRSPRRDPKPEPESESGPATGSLF